MKATDLLDAATLREDTPRGTEQQAGEPPMPLDRDFEITSLREALRKVAIAGVTVNADTRAPNKVYHLLNSEMKPLCGGGEIDGPFVMAVTAPWSLRCRRIGCDSHWDYITMPNEVITSEKSDLFHRKGSCEEFREGHRINSRDIPDQRTVPQMSIYDAEKIGKSPCPTCGDD